MDRGLGRPQSSNPKTVPGAKTAARAFTATSEKAPRPRLRRLRLSPQPDRLQPYPHPETGRCIGRSLSKNMKSVFLSSQNPENILENFSRTPLKTKKLPQTSAFPADG